MYLTNVTACCTWRYWVKTKLLNKLGLSPVRSAPLVCWDSLTNCVRRRVVDNGSQLMTAPIQQLQDPWPVPSASLLRAQSWADSVSMIANAKRSFVTLGITMTPSIPRKTRSYFRSTSPTICFYNIVIILSSLCHLPVQLYNCACLGSVFVTYSTYLFAASNCRCQRRMTPVPYIPGE